MMPKNNPTPLLKALIFERRIPLRYWVKINNFLKTTLGYTIYFNKNTNYKIVKQTYKNYHDLMCLDDIWIRHEYSRFNLKLKKKSVIVDIGANIGAFTSFVANIATKGKIYSYEPDARNFKLTKKNIELNRFKNVKLYQKGVFNKNTNVTLYVNSNATASNSMFNKDNKDKKEIITCIPLENVFKDNNIEKCDLLKIDTEGAEYKIIKAFPKKYYDNIKEIILEFHNGTQGLDTYFEKQGYKIDIIPGSKNDYSWGLIHAKK